MSDVDQGFGAFPRRFAFQQGCTVFSDDVVDSRTRCRDDRASREGRFDQGFDMAVLEFTRRMDADEALAAVGCECALGEVELAAGAADLLIASRFRVDLAIEVEVDAAVDGDEFIDAGDNADVVDVAYRSVEDDLVVVDEIIEALCAAGKSIDDLAFIAFLVAFWPASSES